ncbi:MAG TPA: hypothetical protein VIL09_12420 [Microvirga sp.]|jgi:hypothetical protein
MRKLLVGLAGALALGFGAFGAAPAQAQGFSVTIGTPGYYGPAPVYRSYPRHRAYRPYRPYPVYGRPVQYRPVYAGPRCVTRVNRYWDGYGWVSERRRICR